MSSLSDKLIARHGESVENTPEPGPAGTSSGAVPDAAPGIANLPSLPSLPKLPSLPRTSPKPWGAMAHKQTTASEASATLNVDNVDKRVLGGAVQQAAKTWPKVKIESSYSSTGTTTILLRGPDSDSVARELRRKLSPKVTKSIEIAAEARSSVLGKAGANVKQLQQSCDVKISVGDVQASSGEWTAKTCAVEVNGALPGVQEALSKIAEIVDRSTLKSSRTLDPELVPFVDRLGLGKISGDTIYLSGTSSEVTAAQAQVDALLAEAKDSFVSQQVEVPAFIDPELVAEFGAVYHDGKVYGPASAVPKAAAHLRELAKSTVAVELDISRAHNKSAEHAQVVSAYLEDCGIPVRIAASSGSAIVAKGNVYHISGKDQAATSSAKKQLVEEVNKITPQRVRSLAAFKSHQAQKLAQQAAPQISALYVHLVPNPTTLVYLGNDEDFAPSDAEIKQTLDEAEALLKDAQHVDANIYEKKVPVAPADLRFVREPLGDAAAEFKALAAHVHVVVNTKSATLSGLRADVDKLAAALPGLVASSKDYLTRSNYSETLQFDGKHIKNLIGRSGSNIAKLRSDHKVRIDVGENGSITVKGLEQNVKQARKEIEQTEKRLQDETSQTLQVAQKHHSVMIGNKGKFVRRIKEKYNVHVQFPKPGDENENEILLVGPTKGVQQTVKEFKDLVEYEESHSFEKELQVPQATVNRIIGRGGSNISSIKQQTETLIEIAREPVEDKISIKIVGEQKQVAAAAKLIQAAVDELLDATERSIEVNSQFHRHIVGPNNETRRKIIEQAGGVTEPWNPRTLQVPSSTSSSNIVKISGPSKIVESIEKQITELVAKLESLEKYTVSFEIPADEFSAVLGHGGSRKRSIEEAHGVAVNITRQGKVTIKGPSEEALAKAKEQILSLVSAGRAKVVVPSVHAAELFNRGMLARQLMDEFGVQLQVGKQAFSKDRAVPDAPELSGDSAVVYAPLQSGASTDLTWTLSGKQQEAVDAALASVQTALKNIEQYDTVGFLWLAKPTYYSSVIGPMGVTINALRKKSQCSIFVPKNARKQMQPIEIVGSRPQVEAAVKLILEQVTLV